MKSHQILEELIRAGADINLPPRNPAHRGLTPLILAIVNGTDEISQCLINSLCSLNQYVEDGRIRRIPFQYIFYLFQVIQLYIIVF